MTEFEKTRSRCQKMGRALMWAGSGVFGLLGAAHAVMTLMSGPRGGPMTPSKPSTRAVMDHVGGLGFAPDANVRFFDAWQGFHLSHSLGILIFALVACWGLVGSRPSRGWYALMACVPMVYWIISARFWFAEPTQGIALGALFIESGLLLCAFSSWHTPRGSSHLGASWSA